MPFQSLTKLALLSALVASGPVANAAVLTFEDLPAGASYFISNYNGFTFGTNNVLTTAWFSTDETDGPPLAPYTPQSGTHYIATDPPPPVPSGQLVASQSITSSVDFLFQGAFFTGFDPIGYQLFNNGVLVHTSATVDLGVAGTSTPVFVASGYALPIDEVRVLGTQHFFALDDFTYTAINTVPEPGSLTLMALACAAAFATRRKALASVR